MKYVEQINQYVVEKLDNYSDAEKASLRINGIDPDNYWQLLWSYNNPEAAEKRKQWYYDNNFSGTFRVRDLGGPIKIERDILGLI